MDYPWHINRQAESMSSSKTKYKIRKHLIRNLDTTLSFRKLTVRMMSNVNVLLVKPNTCIALNLRFLSPFTTSTLVKWTTSGVNIYHLSSKKSQILKMSYFMPIFEISMENATNEYKQAYVWSSGPWDSLGYFHKQDCSHWNV